MTVPMMAAVFFSGGETCARAQAEEVQADEVHGEGQPVR
jgi:hypothetical protein